MKTIHFTSKNILIYSLLLGSGLFLGWLLFGSGKQEEHLHTHAEGEEIPAGTTWTCSMHPQIRQPEPGQCPICGMDLIPVSQAGTENNDPMVLQMSNRAVQLANIQTSTVGYGQEKKELMLNGKVQEDERRVHSQTAHFAGRVEQLFINFTGEQVRKGQKLASVYSPQLVTAQEELLEAKRYKDSNPALLEAARKKLKRWKLSDAQIQRIEDNGVVQTELNIRSDYSGIVTEKMVNLGEHVEAGAVFYEIADLSQVWVTFDAYEQDLRWIKKGDEIQFTVASLPGKTFMARITFIDPVIDPQTRVAKVRTEISNPDQLLKPEMFVKGTLITSASENTEGLTIPKSAVMWTGTRSVVYVKVPDANIPAFQMREVTLGTSLSDSYVVEEGLESGEEVVTNGTFTVDAAAQLQGKPSMMNPQSGPATTAHNHGNIHAATPSVSSQGHDTSITVNNEAKAALKPVVDAYLGLKNGLVADDMNMAKEKAQTMQVALRAVDMSLFQGDAHNIWMQHTPPLEQAVKTLAQAKTLEIARAQFKTISDQLLVLVKTFRPLQQTLYVQHCPMANSNQGADWLSTEQQIENPYYGASMLTCGEVTGKIE